ncbi:MAG: sulfite exporter TauE/SafE family protein [Chloroflexi bacterium]|nr:sulfite exporter TauE/SafE family protein [Chloroflexota bacterium]
MPRYRGQCAPVLILNRDQQSAIRNRCYTGGVDPALLSWLGLALLGVAVGAFGTLIGAGGGFLLVPVLLLLYPQDTVDTITAISLAVVCLNALSGSLAYARLRRIDYHTGLVFAAASAPGAVLGALVTRFLPRGLFDAVFGTVLVCAAAYLLLRGKVVEGHHLPQRVNLRLGAGLSFFVGFLASIFGIGGGIIHVPLLIQVLGYPAHVATATSHFILALMAFAATVTHVLAGEFAYGVWRTVALGAGVLVGAQVGAWLSQRVHGRWILRGLALGLLAVGVRLLVGALI